MCSSDLQNRIVENLFASHFPDLDLNGLYRQILILKIIDSYKFSVIKLMFSILKQERIGFMYRELLNLIPSHEYHTRFRNDLRVPTPATNITKSNFIYQGVRLWNDLPDDIKEASSIGVVGRATKKWLISEYR